MVYILRCMNYNEFQINSFTTNDIDAIPIVSGYCNLDVNCAKPWADTLANVIVHDNTFDKDVTQNDVLYSNGEPGEVIEYDDIDKTKYYWDTLNQKLYFFDINNGGDPWTAVTETTYIGVNGLPPNVVNIYIEFNPDALYFDLTEEYADIYAWSRSTDWHVVDSMRNIPGDPHTSFTYDIDTLDKSIKYYDNTNAIMYEFDYGVYFTEIDYTGTMYEKQFEFYKRMHDNFLDVNSTNRYNHKNYVYIGKHPEKVIDSPVTGTVYYNSKKDMMYVWDGSAYQEITQENKIIPHKIFY